MTDSRQRRFSPEVRERAVRLVQQHQGDHPSEWAAITSIAAKLGCPAATLRSWLRQAARNSGQRAGMTSDDRDRLRALERENRELRQANEILRKASAYFAQAELDRRSKRCSPSSTITAVCMASSRSARFCRSRHPPTTRMRPSGSTRQDARPGHGGMEP